MTNLKLREPGSSGDGIQSAKLVLVMPITKLSHSKICFSRLNQRRITAAKKKYGQSGPVRVRAGCLAEIAFQSLGLWTCKEVITFHEIAAGPAIRIYVFFICNIPFSRFINGKCFVGQCGLASNIKKAVDLAWLLYEIAAKCFMLLWTGDMLFT